MRLKKDLEGKATIKIDTIIKDRQTIATTRSFEKDYTKFEELKERISTFTICSAEKLRSQKSLCNSLIVFVKTNKHWKNQTQYSQNIVVKLPFPTNSTIELVKFAQFALQCIFKEGLLYKKAGVILMNFSAENEHQLSLFENSNPKHKSLMKVIDTYNKSVSNKKIKFACQDLKKTWKIKQENLSPKYTTNIKDIITVK